MKILGTMTVKRGAGSATMAFESLGDLGWLSNISDGSDLAKFRGGEPTNVELRYEDGSVFRWTKMSKPRGLLARLWHEARLWWEGY